MRCPAATFARFTRLPTSSRGSTPSTSATYNTANTVGPNVAMPHATKRFLDAIARGMKLVTCDSRFSPEASKGYQWLPVRPGTESAFALAMIHVIFYELKKFDEYTVESVKTKPALNEYAAQCDGMCNRHSLLYRRV